MWDLPRSVYLCQHLRGIAKRTFVGGTPPNTPPRIIGGLSQGLWPLGGCWRWRGIGIVVRHPIGSMVAYLVACHMSVLTLPLNPDIYPFIRGSFPRSNGYLPLTFIFNLSKTNLDCVLFLHAMTQPQKDWLHKE